MPDIFALLKSCTVEQLIIGLLFLSQSYMWAKILKLSGKYHQIDKMVLLHSWIIRIKLKVTTFKIHRNGDYEILDPINEDE